MNHYHRLDLEDSIIAISIEPDEVNDSIYTVASDDVSMLIDRISTLRYEEFRLRYLERVKALWGSIGGITLGVTLSVGITLLRDNDFQVTFFIVALLVGFLCALVLTWASLPDASRNRRRIEQQIEELEVLARSIESRERMRPSAIDLSGE